LLSSSKVVPFIPLVITVALAEMGDIVILITVIPMVTRLMGTYLMEISVGVDIMVGVAVITEVSVGGAVMAGTVGVLAEADIIGTAVAKAEDMAGTVAADMVEALVAEGMDGAVVDTAVALADMVITDQLGILTRFISTQGGF
jgi:hypothetical protein